MTLSHNQPDAIRHSPRELNANNFHFLAGLLPDVGDDKEVVSVIEPEPGFPKDSIVPLGSLDQLVPSYWVPVVYAFENKNAKPDFMNPQMLRESLARALKLVPLYAGTCQTKSGGTADLLGSNEPFEFKLTGQGAWFTILKTQVSFQELMSNHFSYELIPDEFFFHKAQQAIINDPNPPMLAVKAVYFPCGSVALVTLISHIIGDGRSAYSFIRLWSQLACGRDSPAPMDFRSYYQPKEKNPNVNELVATWDKKPMPNAEFKGASRVCRISIANQKMIQLKQDMRSKFDHPQEQWVSSDDIFTAAIWRAMTRARNNPSHLTRLMRIKDARQVAKPEPLPNNAIGNGVTWIMTGPYSPKELLDLELSKLCLQSRTELNELDLKRVQDFATASSFAKPRPSCERHADSFYGPDLVVSSYSRFDPKEIDFDGSPCQLAMRTPYPDGHLVTHPIRDGQQYAYFGVSCAYLERFLNDSEMLSLGFSLEVAPFNEN